MSARVRIAFATCPPQAEIVRRLAPAFNAVADVRAYPCPLGGVEAVVPDLAGDDPHVVVTDSRALAYLAERLGTMVLPFEFTADVLIARVGEARRETAEVAVLVLTGSVNPAVAHLLERSVGRVPVFAWDDDVHRRDLIARCRRMGIRAVIGSTVTASLAVQEGMTGLCLYDRPGETDGTISQMIFTAALLGASKVAACHEERVAFGLVLDRICTGAIGAHDTVLCVDRRGRIWRVFAHRCEEAGGFARPRPIPTGILLHEALGVQMCHLPTRERDWPLRLDVYPLPQSSGRVVVVRGGPRRGNALWSGAC